MDRESVLILDHGIKRATFSTESPALMRRANRTGWALKREFKDKDGVPRRWTYEVPIEMAGVRFRRAKKV